jgi:hypothetical protein
VPGAVEPVDADMRRVADGLKDVGEFHVGLPAILIDSEG